MGNMLCDPLSRKSGTYLPRLNQIGFGNCVLVHSPIVRRLIRNLQVQSYGQFVGSQPHSAAN